MNPRFCALTALLFGLLATVRAPALTAQSTSDESRIRVVLEDYVLGWRDGNVERLARAFETEEGRILWLTGSSGQEKLMSMTLGQALQQRKPQPEYGRRWNVLALDIVDGQLAVAKLDISHARGSYVDYLVLQKISNEWRIVTKTYVLR